MMPKCSCKQGSRSKGACLLCLAFTAVERAEPRPQQGQRKQLLDSRTNEFMNIYVLLADFLLISDIIGSGYNIRNEHYFANI